MLEFDRLIEPDLYHWEQLLALLEQQQITNPEFKAALQRLALGSNYAVIQLTKYPDLIAGLQHCSGFTLEPEQLISALEGLADPDQIKQQLRRFRHRKLVQIIYLDVCRDQSVADSLQQLSDLADLLIRQAQARAEAIVAAKHGQPLDQQGEPMQMNIIGMGKLGGGELNFSSDIDLICTYSEEGQLKGFGQLSHSQFFTNVVKLFKQLLNDTTADGFVYRVDLRLRPWGDSGPVVISHSAFEHYYQLHGREWEQYAMVKARVITGSDADKAYLQSILQPFVYRRYHDYRVFDGLAQLKHKIDQQARRKGVGRNIKIGQGGIREIEFYVQAFQILKGGRNHLLQTPSLYRAIRVLSEQEITERETLAEMQESYNFLRSLENRIQMMNDQQTHEVPEKPNLRQRISLVMGFTDWEQLEQELTRHQQRVNATFSSLFSQDDEQAQPLVAVNLDEISDDQHLELIEQMGFRQPQQIHQSLQAFYQSKALIYMSDKAKTRFRVFYPELLKLIAKHPQQSELLDKMLALLSSISGRSVYFELLYQNIPLLMKLVDLFDSSNWIADEVTRHPFLLEHLLYPAQLSDRFDQTSLQQELQIQLQNVSGDAEMELDVLRQFKRTQTIEIATAEIADQIDTRQVSVYLSELAQILLQAIYALSWEELTTQYGSPQCVIDEQTLTPSMGIIAYGKLGGQELHYQSDLDIIFLHNSAGSKQQTSGDRVIDNATFFSRLAQKIISRITLLTAAGKLYEIDTRLRPDGASGMLVSSISAFTQYQLDKAWVWEHQAITRARYIAGNPAIESLFEDIRQQAITLQREEAELQQDIIQMREKIYQTKNPPETDNIDIKHSRGGLVDIEVMVQYWVLRHANKFASLTQTTDNVGLITELRRLDLIPADYLQLAEIYQTFHKWLHTQVLQNQSAELPIDKVRHEIDLVRTCWNNTFN